MAESSANAWALCLPRSLATALAPLRLLPGISIGEEAGELWLRGETRTDELEAALSALPATARYDVVAGGRLRPRGALLTSGPLPAARWQPLREWLGFTLPIARLPAEVAARVALQLVPAHGARPANAALIARDAFLTWMKSAPELRLTPLRFAASRDRVLVLGTPLPPLPGRACVESSGVIVPAGLRWSPEVSVATLRRALGVSEAARVLWEEAGVHVLDPELFVAASRGAARATAVESASSSAP